MAFRQAFTHALNEMVLDDTTVFAFTENDLRDQEAKAKIAQLRGAFVNEAIASQVIKPSQGLQVLVDSDDLPKEFLDADETSFDDLSDTEKPITPDDEGEAVEEAVEAAEEASEAEELVTALKDDFDTLLEVAVWAARKRADEGANVDDAIAEGAALAWDYRETWWHQAKETARHNAVIAKENALAEKAKEAGDAEKLAKQEQGRARELYEEVARQDG
jgi:hypothetical protein